MNSEVTARCKFIFRTATFIAIDFINLIISMFIAYYIRFDYKISTFASSFFDNIHFILIACSIKVIIFYAHKLYKSLWRYAGVYELVSVVMASGMANFVLTLFLIMQYRFTGRLFAPRSIFAITFMIDAFAVGGVRILYRVFRRYILGIRIDMNQVRRVLIIGAGSAGAAIAREMKRKPHLLLKPVAFVENDPLKIGCKLNGIKVLSDEIPLKDIVEKERIDEIIIALPHAKAATINKIYSEASRTGRKVKILPSVSQIIDESVVIHKIRDVEIEDLLGRAPVQLDTKEIENFIRNKKVLVTGAGGSIGSELCRQIAPYGPAKLYILDNYENNLHDLFLELREDFANLDIEPVIANIREEKRINYLFQKLRPDIVFHAAAHKHVPLMEAYPEEAVKNNVIGTWNVAHAADKANVKRFVLISSDKAVNPANVMGATKRISELIIQALNTRSKTEFVAVRFGNVLGSNGSVIPIFKKQIERGGPVTVTHPDMTRYFMTIPEAAQLVIQAGAFAKGGEIFILDMGEPVRILDLAENMIRLSGLEPYEDIDIKFIGLRPGEKLYEELLLSEEGIQKTKNEKIFVARPVFTDYQLLKRRIDTIRQIISEGTDNAVIREYIKELVPNFKSKQQVG